MNFAEALQRSQTGYVKYRFSHIDEYNGDVLAHQEIDLHVLDDGLCNVRFAIQEQYADWSDMVRYAQAMEASEAEMSIQPQGYSGNEPVCAFHVEKMLYSISAEAAAQIAAMCHVSLSRGWFPASAEEVAL